MNLENAPYPFGRSAAVVIFHPESGAIDLLIPQLPGPWYLYSQVVSSMRSSLFGISYPLESLSIQEFLDVGWEVIGEF